MPITYNGNVTFYGSWSLAVVGKNAGFQERVRIAGSLGSDGPVAGVVGNSVAEIEGGAWEAYMEWSSDGGVNWYPSRVHRTPSVVPVGGLVVTLYADDNTLALGDGDFNDLVVQFTYLNPEVNPPGQPPYGFTVPPGSFRPTRPCVKRPGCDCPCCCQPRFKKPPCRC